MKEEEEQVKKNPNRGNRPIKAGSQRFGLRVDLSDK
jgi:hypothetical protein